MKTSIRPKFCSSSEPNKERTTSSVFNFICRQAERLESMNRIGTAGHYRALLSSFRKSRDNMDLSFADFNESVVEQYDAWLRQRGLCRNTRSFYMCTLRTVYNRAVRDAVVRPLGKNLFTEVFTGMDKTNKRALTKAEIMRIKDLDLSSCPSQDFARNLFLLSFYLRGMSFIDMAYLRKSDFRAGILTYCRHKTGQRLAILWEPQMQQIIDTFSMKENGYLLPIITVEDGTERKQYENAMLRVNRRLKTVAKKAGIHVPLTMYVARHSWATIARDSDVPIPVISAGMGHDSVATTQIYLSSINSYKIDEANRLVINGV